MQNICAKQAAKNNLNAYSLSSLRHQQNLYSWKKKTRCNTQKKSEKKHRQQDSTRQNHLQPHFFLLMDNKTSQRPDFTICKRIGWDSVFSASCRLFGLGVGVIGTHSLKLLSGTRVEPQPNRKRNRTNNKNDSNKIAGRTWIHLQTRMQTNIYIDCDHSRITKTILFFTLFASFISLFSCVLSGSLSDMQHH